MKKSELFKLRKDEELKFSTPKGLLTKIKSIMRGSEIPLVYGYKEFDSKENWDLAYLNPLELSDELTIKNFLEGIKKIDRNDPVKKFIGKIDYSGAESMHYSNEGQQILGITIKAGNSASRIYCISIALAKNSTYSAKAIAFVPEFDKFIEKHMGPNRN